MALYALQEVDDAIGVTREFLFPFDVRRWLKLAVVAFFIGGGASVPSVQYNFGGTPDGTPGRVPDPGSPFALPDTVLWIVAAAVVVGVVLGVTFAIVGAIMEFVFVEALRSGDVTLRRYWRRRWRQGLRLFGFRIVLGLPFVALVVGWLALVFVPLFLVGEPTIPLAAFLIGLPFVVLVGTVYGLANWFTTVFVVPIMIREETGVLAGWRRLWASIRTEWKQYAAYTLVGIGLTIATGVLASVALALGAVVLVVPLGTLAVVAYLTVSFSTTLGLSILVGLTVVFVAAVIVLAAFVQVPVLSYLRYYALLVLGDVEPSLDLVSDRRPVDGK